MTTKLSNDYITNLSHTPVDALKPVKWDDFMAALDNAFGKDNRLLTIATIFSQKSDQVPGIIVFRKHFMDISGNNLDINGPYQVYLANEIHKVARGQIPPKSK